MVSRPVASIGGNRTLGGTPMTFGAMLARLHRPTFPLVGLVVVLTGCSGESSSARALPTALLGSHTNDFDFDGELLLSADLDQGELRAFAYDPVRGGDPVELPRPSSVPIIQVGGGFGMYLVHEAGFGGDLNGDGDARDDFVPLLVDRSGNTFNLGVAVLGTAFSPDGGLVGLLGAEQGNLDYDGDGDTDDIWPWVQHGGLGQAPRRLEVQSGSPLCADGDFLSLAASEPRCGEDLNGDGDTIDQVLHLYHAPTRRLINVERQLADPRVRVAGSFVAFIGSELADGVDHDGDGDFDDDPLLVYDFTASTVLATTLSSSSWDFDGRFVVAFEVEDEVDHDGDGELGGLVLRLHDLSDGSERLIETGVYTHFGIVDHQLLFAQTEVAAGDLNGDGDLLDQILLIEDLTTGERTRLADGFLRLPQQTATHVAWYSLDESIVLHERGSERREITSDGGTIDSLFAMNESALVYAVREASADLNGDGDMDDLVAFVHSFVDGRTYGLRLASSTLLPKYLKGSFLALPVPESSQGEDLNGDGDLNDFVLHVVTLPSR